MMQVFIARLPEIKNIFKHFCSKGLSHPSKRVTMALDSQAGCLRSKREDRQRRIGGKQSSATQILA
jgi:hypothetical protein